MTPEEIVRAMREKKVDSDDFRASYDACKHALTEEGWSHDDLAELSLILRFDLDDGPGVSRPYQLDLIERRSLWRSWFKWHVIDECSKGVNERIRQGICAQKEAGKFFLAEK